MSIQDNTIFFGAGGFGVVNPDDILSPMVDVEINEAMNYRIINNDVFPSNEDDEDYGFRWGFYLRDWASPSDQNVLIDNRVIAHSQMDYGCCAFHFEDSGKWIICQNEADSTLRGFHLTGNCGGSFYRKNTMGLHKTRPGTPSDERTAALILEKNTDVGIQDCGHNHWLISDYDPDHGAWSRDANYVENRFYIGTDAYHQPDPITFGPASSPSVQTFPNDWFQLKTGGCQSYENTACNDNTFNGNLKDSLNSYERKVALNNLTYSSPVNAKEWEARFNLLKVLNCHPYLLTSSIPSQFYDAFEESSEFEFADYFAQFNDAMLINTTDLGALNNIRSSIEVRRSILDSLDGTLTSATLVQSVGSTYYSFRGNLLNQIDSLHILQNSIIVDLSENRESALEDCVDKLNLLPETTQVEENQKFLYRLYLKKAMGSAITQGDSTILRNIAEQCDDEAGQTRFFAMNYFPWEDEANTRSDQPNIIECERDQNGNTNLGFKISPNPADDWLSIQFTTLFSGDLQIVDVTGKSVIQISYSDQSVAFLNTKELSPGIYFCVAQSVSGERKVISFVIAK